MGGSMVAGHGLSALPIHLQLHTVPLLDRPLFDHPLMYDELREGTDSIVHLEQKSLS